MSRQTVWVEGTTCRSCEILIERSWQKIPGVNKVSVNAATGRVDIHTDGSLLTADELTRALPSDQYAVSMGKPVEAKRPSWRELVVLFALVFALGTVLSKFGVIGRGVSIGTNVSFGAVFLIGLIAASSSCVAVVGGLLLGSAAEWHKRHPAATPAKRMWPIVLFVLGRILGYTLLGGLLGVVGSVLTPSPLATAVITVPAAIYMVIMGLDMLHLAPTWLKQLLPRMPKKMSQSIMSREGGMMPLLLGAATFFLPCGFTQALQLYALTTGSFWTSALTLFAFALGTAPTLLALGFATSATKGRLGKRFLQFSGALVVVLGLWNIQNGLAVAGYPISFTALARSATLPAESGTVVPVEDGTQVVRMNVGLNGYTPNNFVIRSGIPVRWEVNGTDAAGCGSVLVSRSLHIQQLLTRGMNTFEFTPLQTGTIAFSCSMGMYRGSFTVVPNNT